MYVYEMQCFLRSGAITLILYFAAIFVSIYSVLKCVSVKCFSKIALLVRTRACVYVNT